MSSAFSLLWYQKRYSLWKPLLYTNESEKVREWLMKIVLLSWTLWMVLGHWGPQTILGKQCIWTALLYSLAELYSAILASASIEGCLKKKLWKLPLLFIVGILGRSWSGTKGTLLIALLWTATGDTSFRFQCQEELCHFWATGRF